jgi:hypothetical protein
MTTKESRSLTPQQKYCGPCQLSRITSFALNAIKNPYLLLQEVFSIYYRCYLKGTAESTWKSYKSGWNIFVKFLVEEKYNDGKIKKNVRKFT